MATDYYTIYRYFFFTIDLANYFLVDIIIPDANRSGIKIACFFLSFFSLYNINKLFLLVNIFIILMVNNKNHFQFSNIPDLSGKVAIVTGSSGGVCILLQIFIFIYKALSTVKALINDNNDIEGANNFIDIAYSQLFVDW